MCSMLHMGSRSVGRAGHVDVRAEKLAADPERTGIELVPGPGPGPGPGPDRDRGPGPGPMPVQKHV